MNPLPHCREIPRLTCALFGAIKAAATLKNTVILVHGPRGCVYHINYILGMRGDAHNPVYCTCMDEHDVVFGAEERLQNAIVELDGEKSPDIIVVLSCCASGIIGEDVESACRAAHTRAVIIPVDVGGFSGDFSTGYDRALLAIVSRTAKKGVGKERGLVNLVGMMRGGPDLRGIKSLLASLGVRVGTVIPAGASLEELEACGRADYNILMCETAGTSAARYLKETFQTEYIPVTFPVGVRLSSQFLNDVAGALGLPRPAPVTGECSARFPVKKDPRIAVFSGPTRATALFSFLSFHGLTPRMIVVDFESPLLSRLRDLVGAQCSILVSPSWEEIEEALVEHRVNLIVGGLMERSMATRLDIPLVDVMHGSQVTVGPGGEENLLALIREGLDR
ncbi:MAG: nitrogenase component 1 [Methanolinea sp.]|nr:nitrogenase component 1 [Methanolinea sp.]